MPATPAEVVHAILSDPTNPEVVHRLVAPDATYVSLNFDNPELRRIMPWTGTRTGPGAVMDTHTQEPEVETRRYFNVVLTFEPPCAPPGSVRDADPATLRLPNLGGLPTAVVTRDTSSFAPASPPTVAMLKAGGAAAELLHLPDHGVTGNGQGLIYEKKSDAALQPVLAWLEQKAGAFEHAW